MLGSLALMLQQHCFDDIFTLFPAQNKKPRRCSSAARLKILWIE